MVYVVCGIILLKIKIREILINLYIYIYIYLILLYITKNFIIQLKIVIFIKKLYIFNDGTLKDLNSKVFTTKVY